MFKWLKAKRERREQFTRSMTERMEFANFAPTVTAEDVLRIIKRDFPDAIPSDLLGTLRAYGAEQHHWATHRVHAAILKLSNGELQQLDHFIEIAIQDPRDVLSLAEMPGFSKLLLGLPVQQFVAQPVDEVKVIAQKDGEQYMDWFTRANER